jgi:hypothetical protein
LDTQFGEVFGESLVLKKMMVIGLMFLQCRKMMEDDQ